MEQLLNEFIKNASIFEKGLFLMISGVVFVFLVQTIFYMTVKIWLGITKKKDASGAAPSP